MTDGHSRNKPRFIFKPNFRGNHLFQQSSPIQGVSKKTEQIGNRSQFCKSAAFMMFLVQIDYFGTYDVE